MESKSVTFYHPFKILKANPLDNRVEVLLKASAESKDTQGETILKSAFADRSMRDTFSKIGIYDYNHLSDIYELKMRTATGKEILEFQLLKEQSIIGYPDRSDLAIGLKDEFPTSFDLKDEGVYSYGYIIPEKEIAKEVIKGIQSGMPYGASVSGTAKKEDVSNGTIKKITLKKIAIAPLGEVINQDTYVSLAKSKLIELSNVVKSLTSDLTEELSAQEIISGINSDKLNKKLDVILKVLYKTDKSKYLDVMSEDLDSIVKKSGLSGLEGMRDSISEYIQSVYLLDEHSANIIAERIM